MLKPLQEKLSLNLFIIFSIFSLASIFAAFLLEEYLIIALPALLIVAFIGIVDFKKLYILLIAMIPLSMELYLPGGFSTDLPTEPLMVGLMFITILYLLSKPDALPMRFFIHSLILIIFIHLFWTGFLILHSVDTVVSLKFFLAKTWYIVVFVFLTAILIRSREDFIPVFWALIIPLTIVTVITIIRHALLDFRFDAVNDTLTPYFRNHVSYAALLSIAVPLIWFVRRWYEKGSIQRNFLNITFFIILTGIVFAYTRGAWLALIVAIATYFIIKMRLMRYFVIAGFIAAIVGIYYMAKDKKYLEYAPNFETTVYHPELGDHLQATMALQDVSSAERVYRWVAAFHMFTEKPVLGHGPGNFYPYYKQHTVESFRTYISVNEERSTVHNYFLLMLVEQGFIGFLIFSALVAWFLIKGENVFHQTISKKDRQWVMAIYLVFMVILVQTFLSDLIEADKTGTIFFITIALIVVQDLRNRGFLLEPAAKNADIVHK